MHLSFPSIRQFKDVYARETWSETRRALSYGAKIKLHGTNVGVRISPDGTVAAQSRHHDLTPDTDTYGFFDFVDGLSHVWKAAASDRIITFYGEWAGPGIARGDAVQQTGRKRFYIFALGFGVAPHHQNPQIMTPASFITCPERITALLPDGILGSDVIVLPWENEAPVVFDFADEAQVQDRLRFLNDSVDAVAEVDPYISRTFGIRHPGEGFVLVPVLDAPDQMTAEEFSRQAFKAKTEKHRVAKQAKPATIREPLPISVCGFLDTFLTEARFEQAVQETCAGELTKASIGPMIPWLIADLKKETAAEMAAIGLTEDRLKGAIAPITRNWVIGSIG